MRIIAKIIINDTYQTMLGYYLELADNIDNP